MVVRLPLSKIFIGLFTALWFHSCTEPNQMEMDTIINKDQFSHNLPLRNAKIHRANLRGERIYIKTSSPQGFAIADLAPQAKIISQWEELGIINGYFGGYEDLIFAPIQNKFVKWNSGIREEPLHEYNDDFFGVTDVAVLNQWVMVNTHNALFIFSLDDLSLLAKFENEGHSVGQIQYVFDPNSSLLYLINLQDRNDHTNYLLAIDPQNSFEVIWKQKINGSFFSFQFETPSSRLVLRSGLLLFTVTDKDRQSWLEARETSTGELVYKIKVNRSQMYYVDSTTLYLSNIDSHKAGAINIKDGSIKWKGPKMKDPHNYFPPFVGYKGKLYFHGPGYESTTILDMDSGAMEVDDKTLNLNQVMLPSGQPSEKYYIVDQKYICWD